MGNFTKCLALHNKTVDTKVINEQTTALMAKYTTLPRQDAMLLTAQNLLDSHRIQHAAVIDQIRAAHDAIIPAVLEQPKTSTPAAPIQNPNVKTQYGELPTGLTKVQSAEDALHVISTIRKHKEESLAAIILDSNNDVIHVSHSANSTDLTALAKEVANTPGAASVYFVHHGKDKTNLAEFEKQGRELLADTDIVYHGALHPTTGTKGLLAQAGRTQDIVETPGAREFTVPVVERTQWAKTEAELAVIEKNKADKAKAGEAAKAAKVEKRKRADAAKEEQIRAEVKTEAEKATKARTHKLNAPPTGLEELQKAIGKLGGITRTGHADRAGFSDYKGKHYKRVFNDGKNSKTLDEMAEALRQYGFTYDGENALTEGLLESLAGRYQYTPTGHEILAEKMLNEHYTQDQAHVEIELEDRFENDALEIQDLENALEYIDDIPDNAFTGNEAINYLDDYFEGLHDQETTETSNKEPATQTQEIAKVSEKELTIQAVPAQFIKEALVAAAAENGKVKQVSAATLLKHERAEIKALEGFIKCMS